MKVRTSVLRGFALLALSSLTFAACDKKDPVVPIPPAVTVTVSPQAVTVPVGGQTTLVAFVANSTNQAVTWQSTNTAVATVDANGVVRGIAPGGPVTIIATSAADPNARAAASVTVTPGAPVTLTLVPESAPVAIGGTIQLVGIVGGSTNQTVNYTSSAPGVATVTPTGGLVTGVTAGTAVITARAAADPNVFRTSTITVTAGPGPEVPQISVTPASANVVVGGTQVYVANVTNATNTAVEWTNETPNFATMVQTGNNITATALAGGAGQTAVFTARAAADPTRSVSVTMTIATVQPAAVSIQSVTIASGTNAGQAVTSGATITNQTVRVLVNVSAGSAASIDSVQVRLGETAACSQAFTPPLSQTQGVQTIECVINPLLLNAQGQPLFPNATYTVTAVAYSANTPVATAQWGTLILNNQNVLHVELTTEPVTSAGPLFSGGVEWHEGNVVVRASPVIFTGGQTVGTVRLCIQAVDGPVTGESCRNATVEDGWYVARFPKASAVGGTANGSAGITTTALRAYGTSTFASGATGPAVPFAMAPAIAVDNVAPTAAPAIAPASGTFIGGNFQFSRANITGLTAGGLEALEVPPGVGGVTVTFHVFAGTEAQYEALGTTVAARNAAVVAQGTQVTTGADLAGTSTAAGYILVVRVRDALGNTALTRAPGTFGVDPVAPQFTIRTNRVDGSPANNLINPATTWQFEFPFVAGNVSGTVLQPQVRIFRYDVATGTTLRTRCINVNTGAEAVIDANNPCNFVQAAGEEVALHPAAGNGYFQLQFRFADNAGNVSEVQEVLVLRDVTAPTVNQAASMDQQTPTSITLSARFRDDVDLRGWDQRLEFSGAPVPTGANTGSLPVAPITVVSEFGPEGRVGQVTISGQTFNLWRGLTVTDGAGLLGARFALSGAGFGAFDMARNFNSTSFGVTQGAGTGVPAGMSHMTVSLSGTSFCNQITPPSGDQGSLCGTTPPPATRTLTIAGRGTSGSFTQPFTAVHVYRVDPKGNVWYVGQAQYVASGSVGGAFEHRWQLVVDATHWQGDFGGTGMADGSVAQQLFAVGVTADREAVRSPAIGITVLGAHRVGEPRRP